MGWKTGCGKLEAEVAGRMGRMTGGHELEAEGASRMETGDDELEDDMGKETSGESDGEGGGGKLTGD